MENTGNEIKKAGIKKELLEATLNQSFRFDNGGDNVENEVIHKGSQVVSRDLKAAFDRLKPHLVCICEQPESLNVKLQSSIYDFDAESLDNYVITGYVTGGSDAAAGVTIIGQKLLKSGQVLNLVSPFTKYENEEYEFGSELATVIEDCNYEVEQYLFNGKFGVKQLEIDFGEGEPEAVHQPVKRGRKTKITASTEAA